MIRSESSWSGTNAEGRKQAALELLVRYVRIVDDPRRIEEWPTLFTDDAQYVVITRDHYERGLPIAIIRDDTHDRIRDRVTVIKEFWGAGGRAEDRHYNDAWPRHIVGPAWVEFSETGEARLGANVAIWTTPQVEPSPRLLAIGEYQDIVDFSGDSPRFKSKKVILDTPVLQDVFVYPL
ncbi:MAG TPA: aromatic-ring-hydroxylating dioxygenase subunit beta [bacterium]|jgi:anthranilate 1,2-dioxygenase small subunit